MRSSRSWGIGELTDIIPLASWLHSAGLDRLMLLPLGTMPPGQTSPYSAASTLAIDPIYIGVETLPDFERAGGVARLPAAAMALRDRARAAAAIDYAAVRTAKDAALALAFEAFEVDAWRPRTARALALEAYVARERWWLDDYALFQALSAEMPNRSWRNWPELLRDRDPGALAAARARLERSVLEQCYLQWVAETQWQETRRSANALGVSLVGDLPFVAGTDSAEVWARAAEFRLDVSTGVPPDAFSPTGQDWGLPTYRWADIAAGGYQWIHQRARRMAALFDGLRVDHTIGLYRTYGRPQHGEPFFTPGDEPSQIAQGEAVLGIIRGSGLHVIAEDLGVIPDFVRASLERIRVPGCKVMRWERDWHAPGNPFWAPESYRPLSAAMTGTHDTEPLAAWWNELSTADRAAVLQLPAFRARQLTDATQGWSASLRDAFLESAFQAGSEEVYVLTQDIFGWDDRINTPGTVGPHNWTWCVPWPVDEWRQHAEAADRLRFLRDLAASTGRLGVPR